MAKQTRTLLSVEARAMLESALTAPKVPVSVQRACLRLGSNDEALIEALARVGELEPKVRQRLRSDKRARIRAAYLQREDISAEEATDILKEEKRAGVLSAVAAGARKEVLAKIEEVFLAKPTKTLAKALLEVAAKLGDKTLLAVYSALAEGFEGSSSATQAQLIQVAKAVAKGPKADTGARISGNSVLAGCFAGRSGLSAASRIRIVEATLATPLTQVNSGNSWGMEWRRSTASQNGLRVARTLLALPDIQREVVELLEELAPKMEKSESRQLLEEIRVVTGGCPSTFDQVLEAVRNGDGAALVGFLSKQGPSQEKVSVIEAASTQLISMVPVEVIRDLEDSVKDVVFQDLYVLERVGLAYEDPEAAALRLIGEGGEGRERDALSSTVLRMCPSRKVLDAISWKLAVKLASTRAWGYGTRHVPEIGALLGEAVDDVLGDDETKWEMFATLSGEFTGSVSDLLEVCAYV